MEMNDKKNNNMGIDEMYLNDMTTMESAVNLTRRIPQSLALSMAFAFCIMASAVPVHAKPVDEANAPAASQNTSDSAGKVEATTPKIDMFVGESRLIPAPGVARIAVGNGKVLTASALEKKEILVFANTVGASSLDVWYRDGSHRHTDINVVADDTQRIAGEIAAFLKTIPGTRVSIVGDKVIVEGDRLSDLDLQKVSELSKRYKQIVNFTNPLGWEQMVLMDVKVVEFPKNQLRNIGVQWNTMGGGAIAGIWSPIRKGDAGPYQLNVQTGSTNPTPIVDATGASSVFVPASPNILSVINLGLNAQLNLLEQKGSASILAEPQLSARNGSSASFLAGGEYPYTVSTVNGPTVNFKPYGIRLNIAPKVDTLGDITASITIEDSAIDTSVTTSAGPALKTRSITTEFNVKDGQTIVLSGLLSRSVSTDISKLPFLGDLPILGALFRSKQFQNDETELVVFVTPTVITPQSPGLVDRIDKAKRRLELQLGKRPYLSDPLQPGQDAAMPNSLPEGTAAPASGGLKPDLSPQQPSPAEVSHAGSGSNDTSAMPGQATSQAGDSRPPSTGASSAPARSAPDAIQHAQSNQNATVKYLAKVGRLALRQGPDLSAHVIRRMSAGTLLVALPKPEANGWTAVQLGEAQGWVSSALIEQL